MWDQTRKRIPRAAMAAPAVLVLALGQAAAAQMILTDPAQFSGEETIIDFEDTLSLLDEVQYDQVYSFAYSPRPGTAALGLGDGLVSGAADADLYRWHHDGALLEAKAAGEQPCLREDELRQLCQLALGVAAHAASAQDLEWTLFDGRLWFLQTRRLTIRLDRATESPSPGSARPLPMAQRIFRFL